MVKRMTGTEGQYEFADGHRWRNRVRGRVPWGGVGAVGK
jgi:hypothetical protein